MDIIYDNCCGIDVHKKLMVACFIHGGKQEVREFGATTRELLELCEWLANGGCQMAAMESTGSYWKPLYNILESYGLGAIVVNAQHIKAVPGRNTGVKDSEWIAGLLQHGLLKASFIPDRAQRELRELVSYRKSLVQDKKRELNRNKHTYFYAQSTRIRAHRGGMRAYVTVAHSILIAVYHILKDGVKSKDLGAGFYNQFNRERKINSYLKKLKALGWDPEQAVATQAV